MNTFNKFYKFGSQVKPKMALYSLGIVFFISVVNLIKGVTTVSIFTLLETCIVAFIVALIEHFSFKNYDILSKDKKRKNTILWTVVTNILIVGAAIIFKWFPIIEPWLGVLLFIILQCAIIAMRYSIYVMNLVDTNDLNNKLKKYQSTNK
ncbi:hypothetical protein [Clostridium senegalense]|uniref:DUF3021 domain-containing protein n=1 Tax=Clostridium senegalense TaxID=1465809 RepID=A0A6M0H0V7_9CLOT|nr:hypothetical protein [Clostridium senegalense]NEU03723.1 hypothetical protein [Clostridium senegalense]